MAPRHHNSLRTSRRALLKQLGIAPLLFRSAPFLGLPAGCAAALGGIGPDLAFSDLRLTPHYPARSPLEDVLRFVRPGSDEYATEKFAAEIETVLQEWSGALESGDFGGIAKFLDPALQASSLIAFRQTTLRAGLPVESVRREFLPEVQTGSQSFLRDLRTWIGGNASIAHAKFEITAIQQISTTPLTVGLSIRFDLLALRTGTQREQHVGSWLTEWSQELSSGGIPPWKLGRLQALEEIVSTAKGPGFVDVTRKALGDTASYREQLLHGSDHWRSVLDGACGIDIYGNNGVAAGDFDNDGHDDLYVCQPAGLPNRLYRNRGDGTFEDVTERAGVGVLDNTSCALFADLRNNGLQDLLVVCGSGPLLFQNQGDGTFGIKRDAFRFARVPQGTFTHAAIADYDRDGRLDIYFCVYSYYLGLDQYHYPVPYYDARNGPPNFLLHNQGDGTFIDTTEASGLNAENDRYSFACAWGYSSSSLSPDLYVVNDFGRNVFYRNNGDGTFSASSTRARVDDVGAGMSASWADTNNDGRSDLYAANMWSAPGQRVSRQPIFQANAPEAIRDLYRRHADGNALYENEADGVFRNATAQAGTGMGRWAWCSDFWDFDHDGYADLYVTNGYITAPSRRAGLAKNDGSQGVNDLGSFFWRQVVAKSPEDGTPSLAYEHGWNALNELIRSDNSWSGRERNVLFANNRDGTFSEVSGAVGMDFLEDGRSFALADFDGDGRLEVAVKNRSAPQLRILHNAMQGLGDSLAFRLRGTTSNRDAIGTRVTLEVGDLRQTKYLQAGSGFLAQHSKELFFGIGAASGNIRATVRWPSGLTQQFEALPKSCRIQLKEGLTTVLAEPFAAPSSVYVQAASSEPPVTQEEPLAGSATWLIDPLKAPGFALLDLSGNTLTLQSLRGSFVLLHFWIAASAVSRDQLAMLHQRYSNLAAGQLKLVAINVDQADDAGSARSFVATQRFRYPVLFATEETTGIYNIIYRYLFDRRRDLPIPCSFLLDREGTIVRVYQGPLVPERLLEDIAVIPRTAEERMRLALPFAGTLHQADMRRNDFTYGVAMFQHGYLEQAAESFQQVVAARPNDAEGYYNLGTLNLRRHNYDQARTYLQKTLALRPDYPEAWNNLGMMAAQEGKTEEATRDFQQSLRLRPGYATALLNLGNVYRRQGDMANAKEALTHALSLQPDDPEANYSLGMLYAQQNQTAPAQEYLQKAVTLRPDYPEALNNLGVLFVRKQDYAAAERQFQTCIRLVPGFDGSYLNLARLYVVQQQNAEARTTLQDLLRLHPDNPAAKQALQTLPSNP